MASMPTSFNAKKINASLRAISEILLPLGIIERPLTRRSSYGEAIAEGLKRGLVKELKPYIGWALDHAHRYKTGITAQTEYQLVTEVLTYPELTDIIAPRLEGILHSFLNEERRAPGQGHGLRAEFTRPALAARERTELAPIAAKLIPFALSRYKKSEMVMAHAQLTLGWYGKDADFSHIPGLRQIVHLFAAHHSSEVRHTFIQSHCLNAPFVNVVNAIKDSDNPANRHLQRDLAHVQAANIEVQTRFNRDKTIPVIADFCEPGRPVVFCNTTRNAPADILEGTGSPFDSKEWDISSPLLFQTHEFLGHICQTSHARIASDAARAQQKIRHLVARDAALYGRMPPEYKAIHIMHPLYPEQGGSPPRP